MAAFVLQRYAGNEPALIAVGAALLAPGWHNVAECVAAATSVGTGFFFPALLLRPWRWAERPLSRFAAHRTQAMLFVGVLPLVARMALLPRLGVPDPLVADEFGYLLLADTFASGRLVNPTHTFWRHFEAVYVFHQPGYGSIYPVAPAILPALAKLLGIHPWIGIWFSAGLMCALVCWMLQGWVPPKWALLGSLLAVFRFTIVSPWMNTYWGGAVAAIGGTLVAGALPRIMKRQRALDSVIFAVGLVILSQSRPFEGLLFAIPGAGMLLYWLWREQHTDLRRRITCVVVPIGVVLTAAAAATMWYNFRLTGNPLLPPYLLHQRFYGTPQTMFWQAPVRSAPGVNRHNDIAEVFQWQLAAHEAGFSWTNEAARLESFWQFYLQPLLTLPLLLLPFAIRQRRLLVLLLSALLLLAGNAMYPFFFPHYSAPLCGITILMIVCGMRHLRLWRRRRKPVGAAVVCGLLLSITVSEGATAAGGLLQPWFVSATYTARAQVLRQLAAAGGKHLILVRYSPHHEFHYGVVFNDADIDRSPVIWARALDEASNKALANYYHDRSVWFFNPDESPATLVPLTDRPYISAVAPGAGRRDDTHDGVSPGAIAILLGGNFARDLRGTTNLTPLPELPVYLLSASANDGDVFAPCECRPDAGPNNKHASMDPSISVDFGGIHAPVLAVSNIEQQEAVSVQVPFAVPTGDTLVTLRAHGLAATRRVTILPAAPGIFQMQMADARIRGIVLRPDGSMVDLQHPAHPGEILRLFVTGLGPMGRDGEPAERLIIGVNHRGAPLVSARYAGGMTGVEEITFRIPVDVPAGTDIPLSVGVVVGGKRVYSNKSSLPVK
ncbi:MAG TPA: hypothetical protein VKE70_01775 [Candidatus Solibacter sp.]|nr:hypothetical protein [Candidatus Solibacter sp.]